LHTHNKLLINTYIWIKFRVKASYVFINGEALKAQKGLDKTEN